MKCEVWPTENLPLQYIQPEWLCTSLIPSTYKCNLNDHAQCLRQSADLPTRPPLTFHHWLVTGSHTPVGRSSWLEWGHWGASNCTVVILYVDTYVCDGGSCAGCSYHNNYHCALSTLFGRSAGLYFHHIWMCISLCMYICCMCVRECIRVGEYAVTCMSGY